MDDITVIDKISSGDREVLNVIYREYRSEFISWVVRQYSCSSEEAKDVYQTSVLILYENIVNKKLTHLTSSVKTYLFSIGKNKIREYKKGQNRLISEPNETMFQMVAEDEDQKEVLEEQLKVAAASLEQLGDPCAQVLKHFYFDKLSMEQIADRLNYKNKETAKNLKHKCLKRLRKIFLEMQVKTNK